MQRTTCAICGGGLSGRQRRFCSRECKNRDTNIRNQSYQAQQARGLRRKAQFLAERGGRCLQCGYRKNTAALTWHHRDPAQKSFTLDLRAFSNRKPAELRREVGKCTLLCANCHIEIHHPRFATGKPD